ncbi:acyl-CoA carboxylase subunit beta [Anaeromyxobacter dehalogenans]|uniref:acyl-CoA carboxylase subunit beta n=1 Tax=Anaeromyxobacter dehalogenans TaxID=161493 RepID=UPI0006750647|nr:acyl-CoA carboxylase subunit beta [Anaeromyxobacter dehalogenans]
MDADGTPGGGAVARDESPDARIARELRRVEQGGAAKYHAKNAEQGKRFARERIALLLDPGSFVEDGALANALDPELPADGVVTGMGRMDGRPVCVMANDSTVKAGSWGARTVEKILRIQEVAAAQRLPLLYLVDSAGARITDQVEMFPGRRGAGRIFHNEVHLSGVVPQICLLFGPSAAGGAYIPAFCDVVVMVEGNASMYLGSPRMAEMVIGEKVTLEELGGARMHCSVSGCGDFLVKTEEEAIALARRWLSYLPSSHRGLPPEAPARPPRPGARAPADVVPRDQNKPFDMLELVDAIVDEGSFLEVKRLWAGELVTGLARIDGQVVGIVANQPKVKGGVLFVDSADKATRFIWLCDAFNVPLLYLADVPGFMIGTKVERAGIIRAGAKMISAVSEATVPRICVVVRKAYGAGLYAMDGPAFGPSATLALPEAMIAVMGPEAAVNAVFFNKIQERPEAERAAYVQALREEYRADIDLLKLASELVVDAVVPGERLREELSRRFRIYAAGHEPTRERKRGVLPV